MTNALMNEILSVGLAPMRDQTRLRFDEGTDEWQGVHIDLLDLLAERGGFSYRLHELEPRNFNTSSTDYLRSALPRYDLIIGEFDMTSERERLGILTAFPIFDASFIVASFSSEATEGVVAHLLTFARPFSAGVWALYGCTVFLTAVLYERYERRDDVRPPRRPKGYVHRLSHALWEIFTQISTQGSMHPATRAGKFLALSWSTCTLLIVAAYTAHLTSFLVGRQQLTAPYRSLEEAVLHKARICVNHRTSAEAWLLRRYPLAAVVEVDGSPFAHLREQTCDVAFGGHSQFVEAQASRELNDDCSLVQIGDRLAHREAGWAVQGDFGGGKCSSLIKFTLHALSLQASHEVDAILNQYRLSTRTITCVDGREEVGAGAEPFSYHSIGSSALLGIFLLHLFFTVISAAFYAVDSHAYGRILSASGSFGSYIVNRFSRDDRRAESDGDLVAWQDARDHVNGEAHDPVRAELEDIARRIQLVLTTRALSKAT